MDSFVNANLILINVLSKKVNLVEDVKKNDANRRSSPRNGGNKSKKNFKFKEKSMLCMPRYRTKLSENKVIRSMSRFDMSGFWNKVSMMDNIVSEEEVINASVQLSKKALFRYGKNPDPEKMVFDCNFGDALSMFIEKRLVENCTDYDILNNCSSVFLKWYYHMCLEIVPDFKDLRVENDDQRRVIILAQMSQLALCLAADFVNMRYDTIVGIYFSIEVILIVALATRLYTSEELDMDLMMAAVACKDFSFAKELFNVRYIVDKSPTWLEFVQHVDESGNISHCEYRISSPRLDEDYTLYVNQKFKPTLKLKEWMTWNSQITRSILDNELSELELQILGLLNSINAVNLKFKPETLRRVKSVSTRMRLREFKILELLLDDMYNTYESQTVTTD